MSEQIKKALLLDETGQQIVEVLNRIAEKQIELATTLAGNDEDKAPSVKIVNNELIKKIDKTSIVQTLEDNDEDKVPSIKVVNDGLAKVLEKIPLPDWAQDNEDDKGYIENKPAIKSGIGENSVIENNGSYAGGVNSSVCGTSTEAHGDGSRAEGLLSRAYGHHSHAEGMETKAYGYRSHTEGYGTTTGKEGRNGSLDEGAHAEGRNTHAYGQGAHTEGVENTAEGNGSHAEGGYTYAQYAYSHAEGYGVYTTMQYQHAQGKFNVKDKNNNYAHIVGNGDDNNHRSNAHTLDWRGNGWFAGNVFVGGTDQSNGKKLATEEYVNSKTFDSEIELYKVDTYTDWSTWIIPENVGKFFYIGTTEYSYSSGPYEFPEQWVYLTGDMPQLEFYSGSPGVNYAYISSISIEANSFYEIPENADFIIFNTNNHAPDSWNTMVLNCPPLYFLGVKTNE